MQIKYFLLFISLFAFSIVTAQNCSKPGMLPQTAIPVCGTTVFSQDVVDNCQGSVVASYPACTTVNSDNAFWYKFTCYTAGTLGFEIRGRNPIDDYDWVLYDVTGKDVAAVFSDRSTLVSMNIYGTFNTSPPAPFNNSPTGCRPGATGNVHCEGDAPGNTPFNEMPNLIVGHNYLLMVNNFSASTFGYDLEFKGGTADIVDPVVPRIQNAEAVCDGSSATIKFTKPLKCSSLTAAGTEFVLMPNIATIVAATGNCNGARFLDSVVVTFNTIIPPGNYFIKVKTGTDNNTLLDVCNNAVPVGDSFAITLLPQFPTPMDSIYAPTICKRQSVDIVFKTRMRCNTIAADGSDFIVTGPQPVTVIAAGPTTTCSNGLTNNINVRFAQPITRQGTYTITIIRGTDANTVVNECGKETTPLQTLTFVAADTVNANFTSNLNYGCINDEVTFTHNGANNVNKWQWSFEGVNGATTQSTTRIYSSTGGKNIGLIVSNGVCADTANSTILLPEKSVAKFITQPELCPDDIASFENLSTGSIISYAWDFGNGATSNLPIPPGQRYTIFGNQTRQNFTAKLTITDRFNCSYTASQNLLAAASCTIYFPTAFTPNNDGLNDFFYAINAFAVRNFNFRVFNRFGNLVFKSSNKNDKWDGGFKGAPAEAGNYVWFADYFDVKLNKPVFKKGSILLVR
jgi:gliding motility-associated-like protein